MTRPANDHVPSRPPIMTGDVVAFRAFDLADAAFLQATVNDPEYQAAAFPSPTLPRSTVEFERRLREGHRAPASGAHNSVELALVIADDARSDAVGVGGLYQMDWYNQQAELGVSVLDPQQRRRGLGLAGHALMIDYAFGHIGLHRIYGHVKADNAGALTVCERLGFTIEGRLRQHRLRQGSRIDLLVLGMLRDEWRQPST